MTRVLKPILKLLSRPVVCAPLKVLEINIYLVLLFIFQVYSRREVQVVFRIQETQLRGHWKLGSAMSYRIGVKASLSALDDAKETRSFQDLCR